MSAVGASHPELERTEAELVGAVRRGDEEAFGELYGRYGRRIFAYVLRMVGDYGRAEDITQEVFISALRRMRESERPISVKPWLYEIAKNACIDEARRRQRSQEIPFEPEDRTYRLAPGAPSPDACFEHDQRLAALNGAFQGLSEQQHRVLALRELGGHSYEEIARQLGITVAMVESTLLRARRRLGQEYDDIASGRRCEQVHAVIGEGGQRAVDGLGVRERRRFARHIAQCQPCARYAWAAGIAVPGPRMPGLAKKLAGLLPLPVTRWPWGGRAAHGGSRAFSGARKAAQLLHPSASVGVGPAAAATVAAVVIAGGGAALELTPPGAAQGHHGAVTSAQVAAAVSPVSTAHHSSPTRSGLHVAQGGTGKPPSRSRSAGPSGKNIGGSHATDRSSPPKSPPSSSHPGSPSAPPDSQPSVPAAKPPSLPSLPQLPGVPQTKRLVHQLTNPVKKIVKKVLPKLPQLPGLNKLPPLPGQVSPLLDRTKPLLHRLGLP